MFGRRVIRRRWTVSLMALSSALLLLGISGPPDAQASPAPPPGSTWSVVSGPALDDQHSVLQGVSCPSTRDCTAVGAQYPTASNSVTLIESWNGRSWTIVPSPNVAGASQNILDAVSCIDPNDCMAVGLVVIGDVEDTLTESWNGQDWSVLASPDVANSPFTTLAGVSCVRRNSCTAVGIASVPGTTETVVDTWDGASWSMVASPNPNGPANLAAVSCVSSISCVAVGQYSNGTSDLSLVERWDGRRWSIVPARTPAMVSSPT